MKAVEFTVTISYAWWFRVYLNTLMFVACLCCCEPDMECINFWMKKAMRITLESSK